MNETMERGTLLSLFLILSSGVFGWAAVFFLYLGGNFGNADWHWPPGIVKLLGINSVIKLLAVLSIWFWSKTGVVVYLLSTALIVALNVFFDLSLEWPGLVVTLLMLLLVMPYWRQMVWAPYGKLYG